MWKSLKIPLELVLILLLAGAVSTGADVKLRIYLQDGTLQAGNLVTETPDTFVILSKEGRVEVKKDKIMFINGKTLKQWQERPDKLFSTEIIPSEIPNPAYVNDKAALPPPPAIKPVPVQQAAPVVTAVKPLPPAAKQETSPASASAKTEVAKPMPVSKPAAVAASQSMATVPAAPAPASAPVASDVVAAVRVVATAPVVAAVPHARPRRSKRAQPPVENAAAVAPPVKSAAVAEAASVAAIVPPARFVRKDFGDYHYARAEAFLKMGERGRALQELHIATVLDRQNPESVLLLGRVYKEQGQIYRAAKYMAHPLLKKREEPKAFSTELVEYDKHRQKSKWILYGATGAGCLAWIPLLILLRRLRRPSKHVITAESVAVTKAAVDDVLDEIEKAGIGKEPPAAPEPAFMKPPVHKPLMESPIPARPPMASPPVPSAPVAPATAPVAPIPPAPVVPAPVPAPVPLPFEPAFVLKPTPPPMLPSTQFPEIFEPIPVAAASTPPPMAEGLTAESVLQLTSMVERAVRQGNGLAVEEKFDLARREYRTALALNPSCVEAFLGLGYLCFAQGQWDLALEHYLKALEIDPNSADGHYGIGRVLMETERVNEAVSEFQKTLVLDPGFDDARETLSALGSLA